jgi:putative methanogenesis marker protein 8
MTDEHIIEAIGKTRIVVRDGRVVEVGRPLIRSCPLAEKFSCPVHEMTEGAIRANIEERMRAFGMCTPDRQVTDRSDFVLFGASELISSAIRNGLVRSAVIVCDGTGTVVVTAPDLVQGIGGRVSGIVQTSPLPQVIRRIEDLGGRVLDPATARTDMPAGAAFARDLGLSPAAVTVATADDAEAVRAAHPDALIIAVHTTGVSREEARRLAAAADLVTACASAAVREEAGPRALLQAGTAVPVFAMTPFGKRVVLAKLQETDRQVLVSGKALPVRGGGEPDPLI